MHPEDGRAAVSDEGFDRLTVLPGHLGKRRHHSDRMAVAPNRVAWLYLRAYDTSIIGPGKCARSLQSLLT